MKRGDQYNADFRTVLSNQLKKAISSQFQINLLQIKLNRGFKIKKHLSL